jgi:hypothetical protein
MLFRDWSSPLLLRMFLSSVRLPVRILCGSSLPHCRAKRRQENAASPSRSPASF